MPKKSSKTLEVSIEERIFPGLRGGKISKKSFVKGLVSFSQASFLPDKRPSKEIKLAKEMALDWEFYSELHEDFGQGLIFQVLDDNDLSIIDAERISKLHSEIENKVSTSAWKIFENQKIELSQNGFDDGTIESFVVAVWVQLFSEPFGELWLAAMAKHAYYIKENDYAFGHLTSLLYQKQRNENDFLRGKATLNSARLGGLARSNQKKPLTQRVLSEMARLVASGKAITRSAQLAHRNGFGASAMANRKLWSRHNKK